MTDQNAPNTPPTDEDEDAPDMAHWDRHVPVDELTPETVAQLPFEAAYAALDEAVERLESNELPLEDALGLYERGVALSRRCADLLEAAELRVRQVDADGQDVGEVER